VGRETRWEEEGEGPEPRTWEVPLKEEGVPEEVTFFMKSFILSFIIAAGGGGGASVGAVARGLGREAWKRSRGVDFGRGGGGGCRRGDEANEEESWEERRSSLLAREIVCFGCVLSCQGISLNFFIFFDLYFTKINGPSEILENYTSAAVSHGVKDITLCPTAVEAAKSGLVGPRRQGHNVVAHGGTSHQK
jgi:hypothetical protein